MEAEKFLEFRSVSKEFGGTKAITDVSLELKRGEILALLGENGAGKSTLIKTLAGIYKPDGGEILFRGDPYHHRPPKPNQRQPVAFIHQDLGLIEWMTVAENVGLAQGFSMSRNLIDWNATARRTAEALKLVGCDFDPTTRVQSLTRTEKSLVAIARALAVEADVLVLDEPTASLPADEVERLFNAIRPLKERGVAMIYVSHRLDEIFRIADRVAVLRDGLLVGETAVADTNPDELIRMIVGRKADQLFAKAHTTLGETLVTVEDLACRGAGPVSFALRQGELLGLVGLRGAGQELIGRALFGVEPATGQVTIRGKRPDLRSPETAIASGIGLIARDRTEESVAMSLSLRENTFLNPGATGRRLSNFLSPSKEADLAWSIGEKVGLRPNEQSLAIEALSGGNQQKVVVGRWLATGRKLLIAEDPTAGVDVGAKADIYRLIAAAVEAGLAVIVISTDFEEIAHICHRALVFSRGRIVRELTGDDLTTSAVIAAASASEAA
ncbi:sugar ABC transporter ATP-binding protein [Agrobacterium rubi]|uniref:Sugar ABC transporter ATP-binding protein n=1 Tax=Agrobacterium rubi TaxID=28099 RepID=A0AAE7R5B2_9HYPH|nr:sugar ABC transporter ATP-binding protein [Agrobacterium rubi]NTE88229.1 sugar ABC transporter ATP-binding protein [Agrobacterium rubi]NTF03995.1 sugar ABC transporter ATP-binding protein [Agrobacterium rubi]NTF38326.1 sugar ABC transporter ATP-binding protein [Agrobacterium rubi]OCJ47297.1 sugar ABC transporter ATP-binding protein [Agrobacterium rubi]QTG02145.1 sugar ABC transporter ATP-binding protein [Agrobacterium rubi]